MVEQATKELAGRKPLPRTVKLLGAVSFLADMASEMAYPVIPLFLTATLGAPVAAVGLIEGVAECTASVLKLFSGWWSDRVGKRVPLMAAGYGLAGISKPLLALATGWWFVLFIRFMDRFGKGMRGSPRDALIADVTPLEDRGRAFGFHRAADTAGAVLGALLALVLIWAFSDNLRWIFVAAALPGLLSVVPLLLVREKATVADPNAVPPKLSLRGHPHRLKLFFLVSTIWAIGNSSDVFLLLRAQDLGLGASGAVLGYLIYNVVYLCAAYPAGVLSDRYGRKVVIMGGMVVFAAAYAGFAAIDRASLVWPCFAVYGLSVAMTEGVGKAFITDLALPERRASAVGAFGLLTGFGALVASVVAGQLWDRVGAAAPFAWGAMMAVAAAVAMMVLFRQRLALASAAA